MIREEKRPEISGVLKRDHCYFKWYLKIFSIVIHMNRHYKSSFFLLLTRYSIKNKICNSSQTELLYWLEVIVYVEKNGTYQVDEWIQLITVSYQKIIFERSTGCSRSCFAKVFHCFAIFKSNSYLLQEPASLSFHHRRCLPPCFKIIFLTSTKPIIMSRTPQPQSMILPKDLMSFQKNIVKGCWELISTVP